jgi:hypothetical protein
LTCGNEYEGNTFITFDQLLESLDGIPKLESTRGIFLTSQKIDFARFRSDMYDEVSQRNEIDVDALLVWTNIRTFLKGSIEALLEPNQFMTKESYLALGQRRCRLGPAQREQVYEIFLHYQNICSAQNLWDDCDRISALLLRLQTARESKDPTFIALHRNKIYVDEIQDYTQAEIYLFFLLSGPGDLFLAGDPAQSVNTNATYNSCRRAILDQVIRYWIRHSFMFFGLSFSAHYSTFLSFYLLSLILLYKQTYR